jgi:hypothetical protein
MSEDQGELGGSLVGFDEPVDTAEATFRAPVLELNRAAMESKEGRREALSRLDHMLEQLEMANLAERRRPPSRLIRALTDGGLSDARAYSISQLLDIVFSTQERLMRANRNGFYDDRDFDRDRSLDIAWA